MRTVILFFFISQGLKTGMYYLRTKAAAQAIQFTVDKKVVQSAKTGEKTTEIIDQEKEEDAMACSLKNREACVSCSA